MLVSSTINLRCGGPEPAPLPRKLLGILLGNDAVPTHLSPDQADRRLNISARQSRFPGPIPTTADDLRNLPKLPVRVRFSSPAPRSRLWSGQTSRPEPSIILIRQSDFVPFTCHELADSDVPAVLPSATPP